MTALVARATGSVALEELELRPLGPTDVLVRIEASGLCHSDVSLVDGTLPGRFPVVLGHEGAGVVEAVGDMVEHLTIGRRVVLMAMPACAGCWHCARGERYLCERSAELRRPPFHDGSGDVRGASGLGTFADAVVVDQRAVVAVDTDLPSDQLSVIGCAVFTGMGSVLNIARPDAGESVLIVGAGGVGLAAVQAARLVGASPIIVIDPSLEAREAALACGADHGVAPDEAPGLVDDLLGGRGVDIVIECVARTDTFLAARSMTRRGGQIVLVGVPSRDHLAQIPLADLVLSGLRVIGSVHGETIGERDVARYVSLAETGRIDLAALIGRRVELANMVDVIGGDAAGPGRVVAMTTPGQSGA